MLKDDDLMPWGEHKGKKLIDVPAHYLLWLGAKIEDDKVPNKRSASEAFLVEYINHNKDVLTKQKKEQKYHGEENRHFGE